MADRRVYGFGQLRVDYPGRDQLRNPTPVSSTVASFTMRSDFRSSDVRRASSLNAPTQGAGGGLV